VKLEVLDVFKLLDMYNPDGEPVYIMRTQNVIRADVPDNLKKLE